MIVSRKVRLSSSGCVTNSRGRSPGNDNITKIAAMHTMWGTLIHNEVINAEDLEEFYEG